ncbi:hypothetical protein [Coxiella burnetii]|uniref:hypothetical protein n=1 Tax=Coxiella burnetii TaxID=777 RepID=UPI001E46E056|nr:hypothetical protein [Coxiella burnetii]MCF2095065.1 hypothetical protein [Coxiella burnetii]MCF2105299.1 hypothetical protein [Coxiella burnetii]MCF2111311.1 hypothetical protein [Coxiella burnetii]MCF2118427.1 hypothetical protein [Coxiella burnetii]MCF2120483.1 hypothetical protein [Coxiella burnetii]
MQTQLRNTFVELEQLAEERLKILSRHKNIVNIFKLGSVLSSKKPLGILGNYPLIVELGLDREIRPNSCPQFHQLIKDNEQLPAVVQTMGNSIKAWNVATLNKISRKLIEKMSLVPVRRSSTDRQRIKDFHGRSHGNPG